MLSWSFVRGVYHKRGFTLYQVGVFLLILMQQKYLLGHSHSFALHSHLLLF